MALLEQWTETDSTRLDFWTHRGLLHLSMQRGVREAYRVVSEPDHLEARLGAAREKLDGEGLLPYAWVNLGLNQDAVTAWSLVGLANMLVSARHDRQAAEAMRRCAEAASEVERAQQLEMLARLVLEHPEYAAGLSRLITVLAG